MGSGVWAKNLNIAGCVVEAFLASTSIAAAGAGNRDAVEDVVDSIVSRGGTRHRVTSDGSGSHRNTLFKEKSFVIELSNSSAADEADSAMLTAQSRSTIARR